jgi:hypothetical protein
MVGAWLEVNLGAWWSLFCLSLLLGSAVTPLVLAPPASHNRWLTAKRAPGGLARAEAVSSNRPVL